MFHLREREYDVKQITIKSKKLVLGNKLSISGFVGFLFFISIHLLISFGLLNNDLLLKGESAQLFIYISLICIILGSIWCINQKVQYQKLYFNQPSSLL
jgi:hypothetical protein